MYFYILFREHSSINRADLHSDTVERERERESATERQRQRQRDTQRETEGYIPFFVLLDIYDTRSRGAP